jgi:ATP-dependent Clp endopeptidase proteolytic subunit ClpP
MVTWRDAREEWVVDIYSRLLADRIIFLGTPIDEQIANLVVAELLHLESEQSDRDIAIYVNSPGGSVYAGLSIYDTMQFVRPDVQTMCVGMAMGMATDVQCARGEQLKGERSSYWGPKAELRLRPRAHRPPHPSPHPRRDRLGCPQGEDEMSRKLSAHLGDGPA